MTITPSDERPLDRIRNIYTQVQEARARGERIDMDAMTAFVPALVIMYAAEEGNVVLAVTADRRIWMGPRETLRMECKPTMFAQFVGRNMGRALERWRDYTTMIKRTVEVESGPQA